MGRRSQNRSRWDRKFIERLRKNTVCERIKCKKWKTHERNSIGQRIKQQEFDRITGNRADSGISGFFYWESGAQMGG